MAMGISFVWYISLQGVHRQALTRALFPTTFQYVGFLVARTTGDKSI